MAVRLRKPRAALMVAGVVGLAAVAFTSAASAVPPPSLGPGSYTTITSPSAASLRLALNPTGPTQLTVSGVTSSDVNSVDIDCISTNAAGSPVVSVAASSVPVVTDTFSTKASMSKSQLAACRLRAVPSSYSLTNYLSAFAGPVIFPYLVSPSISSTTTYGVTISDSEGAGVVSEGDAGTCATQMLTVTQPNEQTLANALNCAFGLPGQNDHPSAATASTIVVDGNNAYLPAAVHSYLIGSLGLPVTPSAITYTSQHHSNGDLTVTETAPLERCTVGNSYPPTSTSCPGLTNAGVKLVRTAMIFRAGDQLRIRDSFVSTDGKAHTVATTYLTQLTAPPLGGLGVSFPKHSASFARPAPNQKVTGFGTGAATMLARSDIYAAADDPDADTIGLTWSRTPSSVHFSATTNDQFRLAYSLKIPARGAARIGFAASQSQTTSQVRTLGAEAVADMMAVPAISTPKSGAKLSSHSVTVKGTVGLGANGLPSAVLVDAHAAKITAGSSSVAYVAHITLSAGRHTITVVARDAAGNTSSRRVTVKVA
jgi:hypothetical protein